MLMHFCFPRPPALFFFFLPSDVTTCGDLTPPPFFGYGVVGYGVTEAIFSAFTNKLGYGVLVTG